MPFTHEPRAPFIPPSSTQQRHFGRDNCDRIAKSARVFRFADHDHATLEVQTPFNPGVSAQLSVSLTPAELRELAHRLLDAAHDLEAFPATVEAVS